MSRTSVVVVNYNGAEDTRECAASLLVSNSPPRLIVVDNASSESGIEEAIAGYPDAELIHSSANLGFGRGNNVGIRRALSDPDCEFVFLLNNDTTVEPDTIEKLEAVLDGRPEAGMAAPRIVLAEDSDVLWYASGGVDWRKGVAKVPGYLGPADTKDSLSAKDVVFASGCAMMIRSSVLEEVGGFDPRFFMYEEDLELCLRVREKGWTIRYAPEALVRHKCQGSIRKKGDAFVDIDSALNPSYPFYLYHRTKNRLLTTAIHARGADAARFLLFYPAVLALTCARAARRGRWDAIRAVFAGLRDFIPEIRQPFVDELKHENPGKVPPERKTDGEPRVAVVEPVGGHGGMDYYDFGLCGGLVEAGVEVSLYTCDETARDTATPYEVRLPYRGIFGEDPAWLRGIRYIRGSVRALLGARLGRARVAHFHFFHVGPLELFNVTLAKVLGLKVVVTAHDVRSFVESLSVSWMAKRAYRVADRIIAQSEVSRGELVSVLGEPEEKIDVIPHGNYLPFIGEVPSRKVARGRIGVAEDAPVLLFFGQIKEVKGLDILLDAMPDLLRKYPDALLVVAGKVWKDDFRRYRERIEGLGISDNCVLHIRYVPDSEVASYYAAADAVVLPYRRIYQSGVLLMAMSYGKPVVVSDIEGMTEVISDGVNGYVFPSGDSQALVAKLAGALSDSEELRLVGERASSHVRERNDWSKIGRMTAACYRSASKG